MLDHVLQNFRSQFLVIHQLRVLRRNHHRIHPHRPMAFVVLNRYLRLPIRPEKIQLPALPNLRQPLRQPMRQQNRRRHQLRILITRIPKHHSLVAGATGVDTHGDVGGLFVDGGNHGAGFMVEAVGCVGIADRHDGAAYDGGKIHVGLGGDFSGDEGQARGQQSLAGHAAGGVFSQARVEDGIGDLIGDLIGMAFGYGF